MKLTRFAGNPVITPSSNWWENQATFNPAATIVDNKITLLYRAVGGDNLSRFGLAESKDGKIFERFSKPLIEADPENPYEKLGIEDPRITKIQDTYFIVYTAVSVYDSDSGRNDLPPSRLRPANWRIRPSLITTKDFKNFERKGILLDLATKDGVLFPEKINGQYVLLHRIYPDLYFSSSADLVSWDKERAILRPRSGFWDSERVGAGSVPIKTSAGWLIFYHGVDENHIYRLGIVVLDLVDLSKVIFRGAEAFFEPQETYEKIGLTPNVVFTGGVLEINSYFYIYYGGGDKVTALATVSKEDVFTQIKADI